MSDEQACRESGASEQYSDSNSSHQPLAEPWKQRDTLTELYHEQELSQADIASQFDIEQQTVSYWMNELGIETRPPMDERSPQAVRRNRLSDNKIQYAVRDIDVGGDETTTYVYQHQLVALLEFEPESVFDANTHVHHSMGCPIPIDVAANLDVLGAREHTQLHSGGAWEPQIGEVLSEMRRDDETDGSVSMRQKRQRKLRKWHRRLKGD